MKKIKVIRIINRFNLGGPTYNVAYLSKYMEPEFETLLIGGMKDETEDSSEFIVEKLGLNPVIIPEMKREIELKSDWQAYRKLKKIIQEFKPDVVHTHASKAGTIGRLAAYHCGVPVIVHTFHGHVFHSYFGKLKTLFYKLIERYLAAKSTSIIAISEIQKRELSEIHGITNSAKIKVIPLGFDLTKFTLNMEEKRRTFRSKYMLEDDELAISIIGRLVPIKNHSLFIESIDEISKKTNKRIRAFIIGDGECRGEIEAKLNELQLDWTDFLKDQKRATITLTSWIHDIDVALSGSDLVCLTSFNEGTPVSLIEAQAAGKPICTTNVGGVEDIVISGKTALLSPINQPIKFTENLFNLVSNDGLRVEMGQQSKDFIFKKFHYTRLVEDMKTHYHSLLKADRG